MHLSLLFTQKNQKLNDIKVEICSILSVENILKTIKSIESLHSLWTEFYDQIIENKMIINSYSLASRFSEEGYKSKSKIKFSEIEHDN